MNPSQETSKRRDLRSTLVTLPASATDPKRSFANVVKGDETQGKYRNDTLQRVIFIPTMEEKTWLGEVSVGLLKKEFSWDEFGLDIQSEMKNGTTAKTLGEKLVVIQVKEKESSQNSWMETWKNYWFDWVRKWKPEDVCRRRPVWTSWYGVPLHAWSERFFRQISLRFGELLEIDEDTINKRKCDVARVKLWGDSHKFINDIVKVFVEGKEFPIRITEADPMKLEEEEIISEAESDFSVDIPEKDCWIGEEAEHAGKPTKGHFKDGATIVSDSSEKHDRTEEEKHEDKPLENEKEAEKANG